MNTRFYAPSVLDLLDVGLSLGATPRASQIPVNVVADTKEYTVSMLLPGVQKQDIQLEQKNGSLIVKAKRQWEKNEQKNTLMQEFFDAQYTRALHLPEDANLGEIKATFTDGVLHVAIPKNAPVVQKIEVL